MSKITAICNQKGGVGKTLTTVSLGVGLHMAFSILPLASNIGLLICLLLWKLDRTAKN